MFFSYWYRRIAAIFLLQLRYSIVSNTVFDCRFSRRIPFRFDVHKKFLAGENRPLNLTPSMYKFEGSGFGVYGDNLNLKNYHLFLGDSTLIGDSGAAILK